MPFTISQIEPLLSATELKLVSASFPPALSQVATSQLSAKITRARKLQDKYRDLAKSGARSARGKGAPAKDKTAAVRAKGHRARAKVFSEAIGRLNGELRRRQSEAKADAARAKRKTTKKRVNARVAKVRALKKKAKKKVTKKQAAPGAPKVAKQPGALSRAERIQKRTEIVRTRAHIASRGRRQQARRDSR